MKIVFKPMGVILLIAAMVFIVGIAIFQNHQLQKAQQDLATLPKAGVSASAAVAPAAPTAPTAPAASGLTEGLYKIKSRQSGLYLTTRSTATTPDTDGHIDQEPWRDDASQKWRFLRLPEGNFNVQNSAHGFWLDDTNASLQAGDFVRQWYAVDRATNDAQKWQVLQQVDGSYEIRCVASGKLLEIHEGSKKQGALVYQADWKAGDTQKFTLERISD